MSEQNFQKKNFNQFGHKRSKTKMLKVYKNKEKRLKFFLNYF